MTERRYGACSWTKGCSEQKDLCVKEIWPRTNSSLGFRSYQCPRKRGFGPNGEYCRQHAKKFERKANHE